MPAARSASMAPETGPDPVAAVASLAILVGGALFLLQWHGLAHGGLFLVGGALGMTLYHASFGFASAWRLFILETRGRGLRAQMLLLALGVLLFFPFLEAGSVLGRDITGAVSPVGVCVLAGAFMFGFGMQLGGGCASGTLFAGGGGNMRMLVTLAFFIIGSVIASAHFERWSMLPFLPAVSLIKTVGPVAGILISLMILAAVALWTAIAEKRRYGVLEEAFPAHPARKGIKRFLKGPWPLAGGAVALVLLNLMTLVISGRPWGITSAFALWGAKWAEMLGLEPSQWAYWQSAGNARALASSVFADTTSIMNFGIIAGAMLAASLAGRFSPRLHIPARALAGAVAGGLLMGYGARIGYGCNIGAYFSGIASGSLHGWVWFAAAFLGSGAGARLHPFFTGHQAPQPAAC